MTIARLPLSAPIESRADDLTKDSRSYNVYFESRDGKRETIKRPGHTAVTVTPALPDGQAQGLFASLGSLLWAVVNNVLYQINSAFASTSFGTISTNTPQISFNETALTSALTERAFTTIGASSFVVPVGVTALNISGIGGGGGGGGGMTNNFLGVRFNGQGGRAATVNTVSALAVTPGETLTITIGAGGTAGGGGANYDASAGGTGGLTTVKRGATVLVTSNGGAGGSGGNAAGYVTTGLSSTYGTGGAAETVGGIGAGGGGDNSGNDPADYGGPGAAGGQGYVGISYTTLNGVPNYVFMHNTLDAYVVPPNGSSAKIVSTGIYTVTVTAAGSAYVNGEAVTFTAATGTNPRTATGTVIAVAGGLTGVLITDPGNGYVSAPTFTTPSGSSATYTVVLSGFPVNKVCPGSAYLDGGMYVLSTLGQLFGSDLDRPDLWSPNNYIAVQGQPDPGVCLSRHLNYIVAFNEWSTEFFYNAGNPAPGSPLLPNQSARLEIGCAAAYSVALLEQSLIWIGNSKSVGKSVFMLDGLSPVRISTKYIENFLNTDILTDVRSHVMKFAGHTMYVLTLHTGNKTLVYDVDMKEWYVWTTIVSGVESYYQPSYFTKFVDLPVALYDDGGTLHKIGTQYYTDNGQHININLVTDIFDGGTTKRKFFRSMELVGDKTAATWTVSHSGDDYATWSTGRTMVGSSSRPMLHQLGSDRRRAWRFTTSDDVAIRMIAAELDFDTGHMEGATP